MPDGVAVRGPLPELKDHALAVGGRSGPRELPGGAALQDGVVVADGGAEEAAGSQHPPQRLARGNEVRVGKEMWQGVVERDAQSNGPATSEVTLLEKLPSGGALVGDEGGLIRVHRPLQ